MVAELEIIFCQSNANPVTGSHVLKARQNDMEEKNSSTLKIQSSVLNYLPLFIYMSIEVPNGRNH